MNEIQETLNILKDFGAIGVAALLGVILYYQIKSKKVVSTIKSNDLHQLPEIYECLCRIEGKLEKLNEIREDTRVIITKLNNK